MAKSENILLRLSSNEKAAFEQAAKLAGVSTSAWIRERLRLSAIRELESSGVRVPFVKPIGQADGE